jgi:hypothetical protein
MLDKTVDRLRHLCQTIPSHLRAIPEADFATAPASGKWSKKQIIGHLIDSAANNHQRFVRAQFEYEPSIAYDQEQWNVHGYYNLINSAQIINMWEAYNRQLAALLSHVPAGKLQNKVRVGSDSFTLQFLAEDYVTHMEHHLRQVVGEKVLVSG